MNINRRMSPNFRRGRNNWEPEMFVLHWDTGGAEGDGTINTIMSPSREASYHFTNGERTGITQHVEITDTAWANGTSADRNHRLWHGHATHPLVRSRTANANQYTISICVPGNRAPVSEARIASTVALLAYLREEVHRIYGRWIPIDRAHIIGHNEIVRTDCPGANFPFDEIIRRLRAMVGEPPLPTPPAAFAPTVGDIVQFTGGGVFTSSSGLTPTHTRGASICRVTAIGAARSRNALHLVSTDGGRVHGWVETINVRLIITDDVKESVPPPEADPAQPAETPGVTVAFSGGTVHVPGVNIGNRWIIELPEGPEGQPQPNVLLRVALEAFGFEVSHSNGIVSATLPNE